MSISLINLKLKGKVDGLSKDDHDWIFFEN